MRPSEVQALAAITARALGYRIIKEHYPSMGIEGQVNTSLKVVCPQGMRVTAFNSPGWANTGPWILPPEEKMLGHWMVRLHMESHYGIRTEHYWAGDEPSLNGPLTGCHVIITQRGANGRA